MTSQSVLSLRQQTKRGIVYSSVSTKIRCRPAFCMLSAECHTVYGVNLSMSNMSSFFLPFFFSHGSRSVKRFKDYYQKLVTVPLSRTHLSNSKVKVRRQRNTVRVDEQGVGV